MSDTSETIARPRRIKTKAQRKLEEAEERAEKAEARLRAYEAAIYAQATDPSGFVASDAEYLELLASYGGRSVSGQWLCDHAKRIRGTLAKITGAEERGRQAGLEEAFEETPEHVRAVATAICKSRTCEGAACCQWPSQGGRTHCPVREGAYNDAAVEAIRASGGKGGGR